MTTSKVQVPRAFISYSWSSASHESWVLNLATQLREDGVDVTLDKWDLKEGHDAIKFMEQMVSDPSIDKVIIVSDETYASKADGRKGGVGTETQIISAEVYGNSDQNKFCAVISELNADGKPFLPTYYKSRIYVDLSSDDLYATNYDQLLRWIFGKPAHPKPGLGKPPAFLNDTNTPTLPVSAKARRAIESIRQGTPNSLPFLQEYLDALSSNFETLRISPDGNNPEFDEKVIASIEAFLPYRNEFIEIVRALARHNSGDAHIEVLHRFFEKLAPFLVRPPKGVSGWGSWDFDNYRFIVSELFLYAVSLLLQFERYSAAAILLNTKFFAAHEAQSGGETMQTFGLLMQPIESLASRKQRLNLNRTSLRADLLEQRSHTSGTDFRYLMQGDFVLYFQDSNLAFHAQKHQQWFPDTLVYYGRTSIPFEIFARSESKRYFDRIKIIFGIEKKEDLELLLNAFKTKQLYAPQVSHYGTLNPAALLNYDKLATVP